MLRRLHVERFKSIYDQVIDFGQVNLFIGPNGSGKSNILEALGVLSAALSQGLEPNTLDFRGVRLSLPNLFKSAFKNRAFPKTFRLEAAFDHGRYECSIRAGTRSQFLEFFSEALYDGDQQVFGRSMHGTRLHSAEREVPSFDAGLVDTTRSVWSVIGPLTTISPEFRAELNEFARFAIYAPQTAIMRGLAVDNRVVEPLGLTGSGLASAFRQVKLDSHHDFDRILSIIWEPGWANQVSTGLYDSEIVPGHIRSEGMLLYFRDKFMRSTRNRLSAFDASEGTLYLLFVATLLAHSDTPNIFALDNVDGTLNPSLVRKLTDHLVSVVTQSESPNGRQAFMTSHHPSSLDSFDIFSEKQRVFVCSRNLSSSDVIGSTTFTAVLPPEGSVKSEWVIANRGRNLSELLLADRIPGAL